MVRSTPAEVEAATAAGAPTEGDGRRSSHPHRRRRRVFRVLVGLVFLLLLLAVVVQLVLWSNLPRRLVLEQLQGQLGLRVQAKSLTTGWLGNTNLRDVTLALPMAEQSFLDMPRMRVKHTSIFGLLLRRPVSVDLIALENPTLYVRRDRAGRWNLAEVAELVARAGGKKPADDSTNVARPKLPEVVIDRATVVVEDFDQQPRTEIKPVNLHGRPDPKTPGILWRYDLSVPDHVSLVGQVAPGAPWTHEVRVRLDRLHEWARPWVSSFPADARFAAHWRGSLGGDGRLGARLDIEHAVAMGYGAKGVVNVADNGGGAFVLRPDGLLLTTPQKMVPEAKVASGTVTLDGAGVRAERVQVAAAAGQLRLDAGYAFATATGTFASEWTDLTTGAVTSSGSVMATLTAPFPDKPKVDVTLAARGTVPDGTFDANVVVGGDGRRGWADMDWTVNAPNLDWRGNYPQDLDGLVARVETRRDENSKQTVVRLANLTVPKQHVESIGEYNVTTGNWKAWLALGAVPVPGMEGVGPATTTLAAASPGAASPGAASPGAETPAAGKQETAGSGTGQGQGAPPLTVMLNVWGDPKQARIEQFLVRGAEAELWANGWYRYEEPNPLDVNVHVKHIPPRRDELDRPPIFGFLRGQASVKGTAFSPRNLTIEGELNGEGVTAYQRAIGDVRAKVSGFARNDRAELRTEEFELLKSRWALDAVYTKERALSVGVRVPSLDLREVGDLVQKVSKEDRESARADEPRTDFLSGTLAGRWKVDVFGPSVDRVRVSGQFTAKDVHASAFAADEVTAATVLEGGVLTVGPVKMRRAVTRTALAGPAPAPAAAARGAAARGAAARGAAPAQATTRGAAPATGPAAVAGAGEVKIDGRGEATVRLNTDDLSQIVLSLSLASWPIQLGDSAWVDLSGGTQKLVIDTASEPDKNQKLLPGKSVVGDFQVTSNLTYAGVPLGDSELRATFMGREIDLRTIRLTTLDGALQGQGVIELEKPLEARASFKWDRIRAARLVELFPALKGLEGTFSGSARVQPSKDPRALGPLAWDVLLDVEGGRYNTIQIGRSQFLGYADLTRIVLNDPADIPSTMHIAGGVLTLWGRASYHNLETTKDAVSSQMLLQFSGLDLDQIVRAASPNYANGEGRLDGSLTIVGATRGPRLVPLPPGVPKPSFNRKVVTAFTVEGAVKLSEAKLGPLPIVSNIYDLMNLGQDVKQNRGRGEVTVRMENGALELNNLKYFNRGTEVRALLTIDEMWNLPNSPIRGNAAGNARPLASLELPFVSEADRVLALLQNDLLSFDIKGTLKDPKVEQILIKDLGRGLKTVLLGEVRNVKGDSKRTSN